MEKLATVQLLFKVLSPIAVFSVLGFFGYLSVRQLAGRQTGADIAFSVITDMKANKYLAEVVLAVFGVSGTGLGFLYRGLYKRHVKRWHPIKVEQEESVDASRTSSELELED